MSYLSTGLAGCSVGPEISRGTRKLTRTPRVIKKKKKKQEVSSFKFIYINQQFKKEITN
jgi:hypothetical protein